MVKADETYHPLSDELKLATERYRSPELAKLHLCEDQEFGRLLLRGRRRDGATGVEHAVDLPKGFLGMNTIHWGTDSAVYAPTMRAGGVTIRLNVTTDLNVYDLEVRRVGVKTAPAKRAPDARRAQGRPALSDKEIVEEATRRLKRVSAGPLPKLKTLAGDILQWGEDRNLDMPKLGTISNKISPLWRAAQKARNPEKPRN